MPQCQPVIGLAYNKVMIKSLNVRAEVIIYPSESAYAANGAVSTTISPLNLPVSKSGGAFAPCALSSVSCL